MGIEEKHAYRFVYLKSEEWQTVRLQALAREDGKCQICGYRSLSNDAHHVWYPENIWETKESQLVILCRPCHDFVHLLVPECKSTDEEAGREHWLRFFNAIIVWRQQKIQIFETGIEGGPKELREAYRALKNQSREPAIITLQDILTRVKKWGTFYESHNRSVDNQQSDVVKGE